MDKKKIQSVVERMKTFFFSGGPQTVSRKLVEKWANEIEAALKEKE